MPTNAQAAARYYIRKRRRLKNQSTTLSLSPRSASLDNGVSTAAARFMSGVTVHDNREGESSLSLSGPDASDFQLTGLNLELKSGVTLSEGVPKTVIVEVENAVKGDASFPFTLTVT